MRSSLFFVLTLVEHEFINDMLYAVFVIPQRNVIGNRLKRLNRIAHSDAKSGCLQHFVIVPGVADSDGFLEVAAKMLGQEGQRMSLRAFFMHEFQKMRLGFGNMHFIAKQLAEYRDQFVEIVGIVNNEHFRRRFPNHRHKIRLDIIRRPVQGAVIDQLLILFAGIQLVIDVGLQMQIVLHAVFKQLYGSVDGNEAFVENLFVEQILIKAPW